MATDKSEPKVGLILKIAALSIATLVAGRWGLFAYFDDIAQAEEHRKVGEVKPEALMSLRAEENARLASGPVPIDKAMQQIAARGRNAASPDIMPTVSKDISPLMGWSKMPVEVPQAMMIPEPTEPVADAGVATAIDGAAAKPNTAGRARRDGGLPTKPPAKTQ